MPDLKREIAGLLMQQRDPGALNESGPWSLSGLANYLSPSNRGWAPWPVRAVREGLAALAAPGDAYSGALPMTGSDGHTSLEAIGRSVELAGLMTLGATGAPRGALGSGAVLPPKATNAVWDTADRLRQSLSDLGVEVGQVSNSTNRLGQHSSYFDMPGTTVRVSDHYANTANRPGETHLFANRITDNTASDLVALMKKAQEQAAQKRAAAEAEHAAFEAPFIERFRSAATPEEQLNAILDAYPNMAGAHNKRRRKEVRDRWGR